MDYPGFGLSEGLHGYIPSFDCLVNDVAEHFSKIKGVVLPLSFLLSKHKQVDMFWLSQRACFLPQYIQDGTVCCDSLH